MPQRWKGQWQSRVRNPRGPSVNNSEASVSFYKPMLWTTQAAAYCDRKFEECFVPLSRVFSHTYPTHPCSGQEQNPQDPEWQEEGVMLEGTEGCDNGNIITVASAGNGGLFEAQNHKTLWRYLAVEVSETEKCLFLLPGPDSSVFLSHSSCSIRGPLCWGGGMDCSWIQWNKLFLSWIVLNPIKSTVSYLNMKVHFNVTFPCHLIYSLYFLTSKRLLVLFLKHLLKSLLIFIK